MSSNEEESLGGSFGYTPTWIIAVVCFIIVFISVAAERGLHKLGKCFKRRNQHALFEALEKLKEELMLLGFISLLLTVFQNVVSHFCITDDVANIMLPCKPETTHHQRRLLAEEFTQQCPEGNVPFMSLEALHQLHIFIFVLAVAYVIFSALTMVLGGIKIREWKHWEQSIRSQTSRHHHRRFHLPHVEVKDFLGRTGKYWRKYHIISWMAAFFKQFYGSVTKSDYIALRSGFIRKHCAGNPNYDFHKYMLRTLEHDFRKITGISWYLWLFVVIFLLLNIAGWHTYFWLSFLPLVLLLIVGAKLEHIITELAKDAAERDVDFEGTTVRPSDELFWFHKPALVLYLIHFILFQNSFEIAFFLWIWSTYGFYSCIMENLAFIIPRLVIGVIVQVLCSYSTLPLYALVSQMGSFFKQTIFDEHTQHIIKSWAEGSKSGSSHALVNESNDPICIVQEPVADGRITATGIELSSQNNCS